jgi:RHS repeat-associated protein
MRVCCEEVGAMALLDGKNLAAEAAKRARFRVAGGPGPIELFKPRRGCPWSLAFGDRGYYYDSRPTPMTTAAICATREVSWSPSFYRGEQYDSDLGLYYLRARYYNTMTDRFVSMDPSSGVITDPKTLHKYLYANGDPVDLADPTGRYADAPPMP